ncbi:hypothetical protein Gasu2_13060 [Galdieria sulphuraria]|nr:hypothetical protein Gasu2_13060 [Galdieria sulphuraria]
MSNSLEEKKSYFSNRVNLLVENIGTSLRDLLRQGADSSDWNEYAGNLELHLSIENISRDLEELLTLSFEIEVLTLEGNLPQQNLTSLWNKQSRKQLVPCRRFQTTHLGFWMMDTTRDACLGTKTC